MGVFVTAIIGVVSVSCFIIRCFIIDNGQKFGTSFFLSDIYIAGEVLNYQVVHLYYLNIYFGFRHPEVYIVLLPALELLL
jgi:cytochrome c oxidase subunit 1